jgi:multidrug transporter EmrE-like cation transporter
MPQSLWLGVLVALTVSFNTLAQICMKFGADQSPINRYVVGGVLLYGCSTVLYILALGRLNLSFVYPGVTGLTIIATLLSSLWFLREPVAVGQWVGVGLMLSGLIAIALNQPPP